MDFDYPAALHFQCSKCAICCGDTNKKTRHILLLSKEAEQIAAATSHRIPEFAVKIEGGAPYSYEMKKKAEDGKCAFLENDRCTVYSLRPLICSFYPFELKAAATGKYEFLFTDECPGVGKGKTLRKAYFGNLFLLARAKTGAERCDSEEGC